MAEHQGADESAVTKLERLPSAGPTIVGAVKAITKSAGEVGEPLNANHRTTEKAIDARRMAAGLGSMPIAIHVKLHGDEGDDRWGDHREPGAAGVACSIVSTACENRLQFLRRSKRAATPALVSV